MCAGRPRHDHRQSTQYLIDKGIERHGEQATQGKRALDYFVKDLKKATPA